MIFFFLPPILEISLSARGSRTSSFPPPPSSLPTATLLLSALVPCTRMQRNGRKLLYLYSTVYYIILSCGLWSFRYNSSPPWHQTTEVINMYLPQWNGFCKKIVKAGPKKSLTFRHRASCILGQAFHYSPQNAFYIFNQQIYFIIWYLLDSASLI